MSKISVTIAWAWPGETGEIKVSVEEGAAIHEASGLGCAGNHLPAEIAAAAAGFGVWGRARPATFVLRGADRVELYRALIIDPKEARRQRAGRRSQD